MDETPIVEIEEPEEIYVHGSPVKFNTKVYCFMRSFHLPILEDQELPLQDTWFMVPAVQHGPMISLANPNIELAALMMIDQNGLVVKAHRVNPHITPPLGNFELDMMKKEAFDISVWEKAKQQSFPYETMFDKSAVAARYRDAKATPAMAMNIESSNITYQTIRKKIQPKPCTTCGGRNK